VNKHPHRPHRRHRWTRHRTWRSAAGVTLAAAAFAVGLYATGVGNSGTSPAVAKLPLAPASSLGHLSPSPPLGRLGPENVPLRVVPALAPASSPAPGQKIDRIACASLEQLAFHIHAHLAIFVRGTQRQVPYGVGIAPPLRIDRTPVGDFALAGACFTWLHTHAGDGIIHIESPVTRTYTLGEFFDIWNQPLTSNRVGPASGAVTAFFDGRHYLGNPRTIPLLAHAQIQLDVGRPLVAPESIHFPTGL
jgi:hypothetical protein